MRAAFYLLVSASALYASPEIFETTAEEQLVLDFQKLEKLRFGAPEHVERYNTLVTGNTLLMQRSGRKRLFDHNIFLRALFRGDVELVGGANPAKRLKNAAFVDIGSGILFGDGAPTVRDIFEDSQVRPFLSTITATDIDDPQHPQSQYIRQYRQSLVPLPFPVEEVPMTLDTEQKWRSFLGRCAPGQSSLILRAVNTGPDLFYSEIEIQNHFRSLARVWSGDLMYLFSKFVLWKPAGSLRFQVLGEMDPVGTIHGYDAWLFVDWEHRTPVQAFRPNVARAAFRNQ